MFGFAKEYEKLSLGNLIPNSKLFSAQTQVTGRMNLELSIDGLAPTEPSLTLIETTSNLNAKEQLATL